MKYLWQLTESLTGKRVFASAIAASLILVPGMGRSDTDDRAWHNWHPDTLSISVLLEQIEGTVPSLSRVAADPFSSVASSLLALTVYQPETRRQHFLFAGSDIQDVGLPASAGRCKQCFCLGGAAGY